MSNVFILTYCRNMDLFYGTELIFKSLRIGFPNAEVVVVDNSSLPEAREKIESLARGNDCRFQQLSGKGTQHHDFIQDTISGLANNGAGGSVVFLDPDICFWENCEDFEFDGLVAGKLIQPFHDSVTKTRTMPRLHTSFLWIPDVRKLAEAIRKARVNHFDFHPFLPYSFVFNGKWYRYDTGASLYAAFSDRVSRFTEKHLNRYDHIFCGSHIDWLLASYDSEIREFMLDVHERAKRGDIKSLRGIWRRQNERLGDTVQAVRTERG
ncbi:hypothetical protein HZA56_04930 [Candidatus Poribacteria bacterium]|nr:hypothetical protein [Candidatus Poribacteria bacterium]